MRNPLKLPTRRRWARPFALAAVLVTSAAVARADLPAILSRGSLRVLVSADENPTWFAVGDTANPGFERDLLEGFARLHKIKVVVVPVTRWERAIPDLLSGQGDVIAGINDTPVRRQQIDFTAELVPSRQIVVTRKPGRVIRSTRDLQGERVAVKAGTTWVEALETSGVPKSQLRTFPDLPSCLEALRSGHATATVMDVVDFLLERRADPDLLDGMELGATLSSAWGVRKTDADLKKELEEYIQNLKKTASWSRLVVRYFGEDALRVLAREAPSPAATH